MPDARIFRMRITYGKLGRCAMLSHLEITHALERMVRRAQLPFALSQGFSPHMKISFGSALPVGVGGTSEIFDLQLTDYVSPDEALYKLQANAPEWLMPTSAKYVEPKSEAASVAFPCSLYEVVFDEQQVEFVVPESIEVVRKKKAKTISVGDHLVFGPEVDGNVARFALMSSQSGSLRPDVFLNSSCSTSPISITRIAQGKDVEDL